MYVSVNMLGLTAFEDAESKEEDEGEKKDRPQDYSNYLPEGCP